MKITSLATWILSLLKISAGFDTHLSYDESTSLSGDNCSLRLPLCLFLSFFAGAVCEQIALDVGNANKENTCFASLWLPLRTPSLSESSSKKASSRTRPVTRVQLTTKSGYRKTFTLVKDGQTVQGKSQWVHLDVTEIFGARNGSLVSPVYVCQTLLPAGTRSRPGSARQTRDEESGLLTSHVEHLTTSPGQNNGPLIMLGKLEQDPLDVLESASLVSRSRRSSQTDPESLQTATTPGGNDVTQRKKKHRRTNSTCSVQPLRLNLKKDLGLKNVVHPRRFNANDCLGRCSKKHAPKYASEHGHMRALLRRRGRPVAKFLSGSTCVPFKFSSLSVIMRTVTGLRTVWLKNLVVEECACS